METLLGIATCTIHTRHHVESVDVDGGIEIGPLRKHPHFHVLVSITHWSYLQLDYFKMNSFLEMMFKGLDPGGFGWGTDYELKESSGRCYYSDNESPWVDVRLYPQDNWQQVIAAYVRKNAIPSQIEAIMGLN